MQRSQTAIMHYTAPPVIGGVEAVMEAHASIFAQSGYPVTVIAGRGEEAALPPAVSLIRIPLMDSRHPEAAQANRHLQEGSVPSDFEQLVEGLVQALRPQVHRFDTLIVHNIFTKHFNLPLTTALFRLLDAGDLGHCIAWCHDLSWTSPSSRSKVHPGYPWDLLRTFREDVTYVAVSQRRQRALADLLGCPLERVLVVYNGVDPRTLLGLSAEGAALVSRLNLLESELILLMPVRVTQAKNIETALRVVAALKARGSRPKLILTGPPDPHEEQSMAYFRSLQDLRRELDVEQEMRFVFESGPEPDQPFTIEAQVVGDLFRVSDLMFMPSHREGFGMPVLEAGLVGIPAVCTDVPAAEEIGGQEVILFDEEEDPQQIAERILTWAEGSRVHRLRRRVRQNYTWKAIFQQHIHPLLDQGRAT